MWAAVPSSSSRQAALLLLRCSPGLKRPRPLPLAATTAARALSATAAGAGGSSGGSPEPPSASLPPPPDPSAVADAVGSWHAFVYDSVPVQGMQAALEAVHATTGLPWWASIALSTLAFRAALLPVVRYQARALARLAGAGPMLAALNQALSQRLDKIRPGDVTSTTEACRAYAGGCSAALKAQRVSLAAAVASPLVQLPVFVTFALANRRMIDTAVPGLDSGGVWWFEDLTEADPLLLLPLACLGSTYLNLELGFARLHESQTVLRFIKDNLQLFLILGAPLTSTLPAGVFVYWLTSSLCGHAQHFALKSPAVRAALGFPPMLLAPPPTAPGAAAAAATANAAPGPAAAAAGAGLVDPRLMAKAMEALEEYEARRQRKMEKQPAREEEQGDGRSSKQGTEAPHGLSTFPTRKGDKQ